MSSVILKEKFVCSREQDVEAFEVHFKGLALLWQ